MLQNLELVKKVEEIAAKKGATPGQIALGWLHAQGEDVFPVSGRNDCWSIYFMSTTPTWRPPACPASVGGQNWRLVRPKRHRRRLLQAPATCNRQQSSFGPCPDIEPMRLHPQIPGTRKISRLEENAGGFAVKLSKEDLTEIDAAFPDDVAVGDRCALRTQPAMSFLFSAVITPYPYLNHHRLNVATVSCGMCCCLTPALFSVHVLSYHKGACAATHGRWSSFDPSLLQTPRHIWGAPMTAGRPDAGP